MDRTAFLDALLDVMERKQHWAWPAFTSGMVPKDRLHIHLEQEYACYVRDFPVLVARAYVQCDDVIVRRELIENVYEEETGGIAAGRPHPELFLEYPRGLGFDLTRFDDVTLLPEARAYRDTLDAHTLDAGWEIAAAVTTLFIEGTPYERGEIDESAPKRPAPPLNEHPLVKHYGLAVEHLALTRAHRAIAGEHRKAAWSVVLDHTGADKRAAVIQGMQRTLSAWLTYRDGVARACGIVRGPDGAPRLAD